MTTLSPPAGNPAALDDSVQKLLMTERALEQAATDIAVSLAEGSGKSIQAARERSGQAQSAMTAAHGRYHGARAALQDYSVHLHTFHHDATSAMYQESEALSQLQTAQYSQERARQQFRIASLNPEDPFAIEEWRRAYLLATDAVEQAQQAVAIARARYAEAVEQLDEAARAAQARIVAAFEETNDRLRDLISAAISAVTTMIEDLAEWAVSFFKEVVELVIKAVAILLAAVLVAVAVVALAFVLVQLMTAAAVVVALLIVAAVAVIAAALLELVLLIRVGETALRAANALGLDGLDRIRFVVAALGVACPPIALLIHSRMRNELSKPEPEVDQLDPTALTRNQFKELRRLDQHVPESVDDLLTWAGQVDAIGGDSQAVVDVARIEDEQGNVSWIVTLPSTADWVVGGDKGAPNDLDADLMLILYPELRSQYETAVLKAMEQAHISPGDPVVLTGWSLGGIMGGSLIESQAGGYSYAGLVCAGSPIDHMAISPDIPVIQVKHTLDPVHRTDMIDEVPDTEHHVSLWDGPRSGGASPSIKTGNLVGHANDDYLDTLQDHLTYNEAQGGPNMNSDFAVVLPQDDPNTPQRVTVEHTQYAFSE